MAADSDVLKYVPTAKQNHTLYLCLLMLSSGIQKGSTFARLQAPRLQDGDQQRGALLLQRVPGQRGVQHLVCRLCSPRLAARCSTCTLQNLSTDANLHIVQVGHLHASRPLHSPRS